MPDHSRPQPRRINVELDPALHDLLLRVHEFIASIHHVIDPDFFRITEAEVEWLERLLGNDGATGATITLNCDELHVLDTIVMAAWEYSARRSTPATLHATDDEMRWLQEWRAELFSRFRQPASIH